MDSAADPPSRRGLPHSEIPGSKPARGSPGLFAACHVLHRLLAPRHPPDALAFLGPHQRQPQPPPAKPAASREPRRQADGRATGNKRMRRPSAGAIPATTTHCKGPPAREQAGGPHTHAIGAAARRRKDEKRAAGAKLASTRPGTTHARRADLPGAPWTGTSSSPPHDVQTAGRRPIRRWRRRRGGVPFRDRPGAGPGPRAPAPPRTATAVTARTGGPGPT